MSTDTETITVSGHFKRLTIEQQEDNTFSVRLLSTDTSRNCDVLMESFAASRASVAALFSSLAKSFAAPREVAHG